MAIAPTAGATASGTSQVTSSTITVPSGVLGGDVVFVWAIVVPISASTATITASSTGTTPVAVPSGSISGSESLPATVTGQLFSFTAAGTTGSASSDVGKVITLTYSVSGFPATALESYSGAAMATPVDVIGSAFGGAATASVTCATKTTGVGGDWAVFFGGGAAEGGNLTIPSGSTSRQAVLSGSDVGAAISDSNAAVGGAGTSIGGGTFTTSTATNSILVALTVGLQAAGAGGTGASGAAEPPIIPPHPQFTRLLLEEAWQRADWQAQGVADLTVAYSSSSGGVDTYNVTSPFNGTTAQQMRVLKPTAPNGNYPHAFLIMLPVDPNQGTTFGDSIGTAQSISAHNNYNLTCIQPGYAAAGGSGTGPWFADNPLNQAIYQETYTLKVLAWIQANLATTGTEKVYLIGFSRSGIGGQGLFFRHQSLFAAVASWDSPMMMTDYNGTDPTNGGSIGGNSSDVYGTSSNFTTHYELPTQLAGWQATGQFAVNRIWLGLGPAFPADIPAYDAALTAAGIPHTYTFADTVESHAWQTDWVAAALASIIPSNYTEATTVAPQQIPPHMLRELLEVASYRLEIGSGGAAAAPPAAGAATIAGQGSLGDAAAQGSGGTLGGQGSLGTPDVTEGAGGTLAGAGSLGTPDVTEQAVATMAGAGALATAATELAGETLAGQGSLGTPDSTDGSGGTLAGAGSLGSPDVTQGAGATLAGAGSLGTPDVTEPAPAALTGAGALATAVTEPAVATIAGSGALADAAAEAAGATIAGSGALATAATEAAPATLAGAGQLGTPDSGEGSGATIGGQGSLGAPDSTIVVPATITGQGQLAASTSPSGAGSIGGQGSLGQPDSTGQAPATLAGQGQLATSSADLTAATIGGQGQLGAPDATEDAGLQLSGAGRLGAPDVTQDAGLQLAGLGQLAASGQAESGSTAALQGTGALGPQATQAAPAAMAGQGSLEGTPQVTRGSVLFRLWSATGARQRWEVTGARQLWSVPTARNGSS